jgi:pilus assembly protein Flp/PilA
MNTRTQAVSGRSSASRQRGQGMTEYIIIVALIAIAAIGVVSYFGGTARSQMSGMAQELSGQNAGDAINQAQEFADSAFADAQLEKNMGQYDNEVSN